jgi:hypothetical protein
LLHIQNRWDLIWRADAMAAELNVDNLHAAHSLMQRADAGDLEATIDLVGAATWCLSAGPLVTVTDLVKGERRPCYERFGEALASRERLERTSFVWLMQLVSAGIDDAALYASALTRGIGPNLLGGADANAELREIQQAQLLSQLQSMAQRGSANAASELNAHYGGDSALTANDADRALYYARLTEQLDPARGAIAVTQ